MTLVDNKKPVIGPPILLGICLNLRVGLLSSIGINVVNHGCSKIASKIM